MFPIITIAALLQFCAPASKTAAVSSYSEDLAMYRNDYSQPVDKNKTEDRLDVTQIEVVDPTHDIHEELDSVTSIILESRKNMLYVDGFSIQIYSGNSRDLANSYKSRAYELLETQSPRVIYDQPNYKVQVGQYYTKLEANKDFNLLKSNFSRAVLIPAKIKIEDR